LIYKWARIASVGPRFANFFAGTPPFSSLVKWLAGISSKRTIPKFSSQSFRKWFKKNSGNDPQKPRVILWPDTFNNFFVPHTLKAAVGVLQAAGFQVLIPRQVLCCGRPLYDFGMLKTAKKLLLQILDDLREFIREGIPLVGLEPSCVAVFRDELGNLLPDDDDAKKLSQQTFTLGEFLEKIAKDFKLPQFRRKAIVHGHCHQKSIMKMDAELNTMKKLGLDFEVLDSGCCGMAGYFGYQKGRHYTVSIKAAERVLLPAVRKAGKETLIIADGFSCREQIEQQTGRKGMHLAEVILMAIDQNRSR